MSKSSDFLASAINKSKKIHIESLRDDMKARKDKSFFWPNGTQIFCGRQGSGKTISAVRTIYKLKKRYSKSILVSNLDLAYLRPILCCDDSNIIAIVENIKDDEYILFKDHNQLDRLLVGVNNGRLGVIYLIDEIQTYFNALESKNIPMYVFTEISQQRKQRKLIIGTSQLFMRMAKPFREQCDNAVMCRTHLGCFTTNRAYDGMTLEFETDGKPLVKHKKYGWFFHNRYLRNGFDTYQKVVSGSEQFSEENKPIRFVQKGKHIEVRT